MPKRSSPRSSPNGKATAPAVAIVVSRYNASVTDRLLDAARQTYHAAGGSDLTVIDAPGSFELPALALAAAKTGRFDGIVALGCLIKGETSHDKYIAEAVAHGLVNVTLVTGIPVAFGLLTTDTPEQALARAGGDHGNKGADAMNAVLETINAIRALAHPGTRTKAASKPDKAARSPRR